MRFLKKPQIDVPAEQIFKECVDRYTGRSKEEKAKNKALREKLHKCDDLVQADSKNYQQKIRSGSYTISDLPADVTPDDMANVYSQIFTKKNPVQTYYRIIRGEPYYAKCPICGSRNTKKHLDHYLPKSKFPTLCVTPDNLVPICSACNEEKRTYYSLDAETRPFHLYFDKDCLPLVDGDYGEKYQEIFLRAEIAQDYHIMFQTDHPAHRTAVLRQRLDKHVEIYGLLKRYEECVDPDIAQLWCDWQDKILKVLKDDPELIRTEQMESDILQDLISEQVYKYRRLPNTWESALFRAMKAQSDTIYTWFKDNEREIRKAVQKHCSTDPDEE